MSLSLLDDIEWQVAARFALVWNDPRSAYFRLAGYHLTQVLIREDCEHGAIQVKDPDWYYGEFEHWCRTVLGYVPAIDGKEATFKSDADKTIFYLRWHHVEAQ